MVARIFDFSLRQRVFVLLGVIALIVAGVWSAFRLPMDAVPDITNVQVQINTTVAALAAEEIEKQITVPIETEMQGLQGLVEMRSISRFGLSQVTLVFDEHTDIYRARQLATERLQNVLGELPPATQPRLAPITTGLGEVFFYTVDYATNASVAADVRRFTSTSRLDQSLLTSAATKARYEQLLELRQVQEWTIKPLLRTVPGVTEVNTSGGYEKQIVVLPHPEKMMSAGLSFDELAGVVGENVENAGGGIVQRGGEQITIRSVGRVQTTAEIADLPIKFGGRVMPLLVKDVADVGIGSAFRTGASTMNGDEAIVCWVLMLNGANSRLVAQRADEKLKEIQKKLPEGVVVKTVYNRSELVNHTIGTVEKNLFEGSVLVAVVLLALIGNWRAALIVAAAIPLSMLFALTGMVRAGVSGNLMSLGAVDFGLIVDGAVVIVENVVRQLGLRQHQLGRRLTVEERMHTILAASKQVGRPMVFGVAIITIVYVPILALTGIEGKMFKPMALTVIFALVGALVLALTVVPVLCSFFLTHVGGKTLNKKAPPHPGPLPLRGGEGVDGRAGPDSIKMRPGRELKLRLDGWIGLWSHSPMTARSPLLPATLALAVPAFLAQAEKAEAPKYVSQVHAAYLDKPALGGNDTERAAIQRAVDAVYPALVRIHVVHEEGSGGRMQKRQASGSGTIITEDGYILTNHHVAGRATRVVCRLPTREEVDAVLVGTDPLSDLAVLKLDLASRRDPKSKLPVAKFGNSERVKVGDVVLAMGSPAGLSQSVTKGIVANTAMISPGGGGGLTLDGEKVGELVRWIGHDAVIFPGNSGGPLVNLRGEIVGVNEVGIGSLGGAIPGNLAQAVAKELIQKGRVSRSWIGLEAQPLLKKMTREKGVLVSAVLTDSPASKAGIRPGDLITEFNGAVVPESRAQEDIPVFNRMVLTTPVGGNVAVKGLRGGKPLQWKLTTVDREPNQATETELLNWGLTVRDFTRVSALERHRKEKKGVLVDSIRSGGPCAECKPPLKDEDVIVRVGKSDIATVDALARFTREFTKGLSEPQPVLVTFERGSQQLVTVARIGPEVQDDKPARPAKAWLGAETQVLTRELAETLDLEGRKGVRVTRVVPDSPAAAAGLKVGDIFLKLDGQVIAASTLSDQELFDNLIRQYKVGGAAEIDGVRDGQPLKLTVALGRQPKPSSELEEFRDDRFEFTAREMSLSDRLDARLESDTPGVRIGSVQSAGWAALAGLSSGDVLLSIDERKIESVPALREVLTKFRESKPRRVVFFVKRGIRTQFIELEPKW